MTRVRLRLLRECRNQQVSKDWQKARKEDDTGNNENGFASNKENLESMLSACKHSSVDWSWIDLGAAASPVNSNDQVITLLRTKEIGLTSPWILIRMPGIQLEVGLRTATYTEFSHLKIYLSLSRVRLPHTPHMLQVILEFLYSLRCRINNLTHHRSSIQLKLLRAILPFCMMLKYRIYPRLSLFSTPVPSCHMPKALFQTIRNTRTVSTQYQNSLASLLVSRLDVNKHMSKAFHLPARHRRQRISTLYLMHMLSSLFNVVHQMPKLSPRTQHPVELVCLNIRGLKQRLSVKTESVLGDILSVMNNFTISGSSAISSRKARFSEAYSASLAAPLEKQLLTVLDGNETSKFASQLGEHLVTLPGIFPTYASEDVIPRKSQSRSSPGRWKRTRPNYLSKETIESILIETKFISGTNDESTRETDINKLDVGNSSLHVAAAFGSSPKTLLSLIDRGANDYAVNNAG
jgi:hypothetical protein